MSGRQINSGNGDFHLIAAKDDRVRARRQVRKGKFTEVIGIRQSGFDFLAQELNSK